jgi:hypothetical protein
MVKEKSAVEVLREAGCKINPNIPNVAIFMGKTKKKQKKKEKK